MPIPLYRLTALEFDYDGSASQLIPRPMSPSSVWHDSTYSTARSIGRWRRSRAYWSTRSRNQRYASTRPCPVGLAAHRLSVVVGHR